MAPNHGPSLGRVGMKIAQSTFLLELVLDLTANGPCGRIKGDGVMTAKDKWVELWRYHDALRRSKAMLAYDLKKGETRKS